MRPAAVQIRSATERHRENRKWLFLGVIVATLPLYWMAWVELVKLSLSNENYSHVLLVPVVSAWLLWRRRDQFSVSEGPSSRLAAAIFFSAGAGAYVAGWILPNSHLSLWMLSLVLVWVAGLVLAFGAAAARIAAFALAYLVFLVPPPDSVLQLLIGWLQRASAEVTHWLFQLIGVPVYRDGLVFSLPNLTIEVARECSGIRSSICLLLVTLVAAHLLLKRNLSRLVLVAFTIPIAVVKNGLRIVTLSMLSIYVDPRFIQGEMHRQAGLFFFVVAVGMILLISGILQRMEMRHDGPAGQLQASQAPQTSREA